MKEVPKLLISNESNKIYDLADMQAVGMKGGEYFPLKGKDLIKLPPDSELFMLPDRSPVGFDPGNGEYLVFDEDPYDAKKGKSFARCGICFTGIYR